MTTGSVETGNQNRVLIAEDDLTARTILAGVLKKWGYETVVVKDGQAAWDILQQPGCPRLAILDWMMPGMDGLEVIRLARAQFSEQPPYIILLTGKDEKGDIKSGLETGANDYIKKPFENEELFARIRVGQRTIELQTRLYEAQQRLAHLATHDSLTGILNRRAILDQLKKELSRTGRVVAAASSTPAPLSNLGRLSVGYFDIDHFKHINDQYSHQTGDEVLKGMVDIISSQLRLYDSIGRLGGDEFLVVAPGADKEEGKSLFERLLSSISGHKIITGAGEINITVSLGVVTASPTDGEDELLDRADTAMYRAKREGGNQIFYS
jgi:two-component system, cell cycle response regulator